MNRLALPLFALALGALLSACHLSSSAIPTRESDIRFPADAVIRRNDASRAVESVRARNLDAALEQQTTYRILRSRREYAGMALWFMQEYRKEFLLTEPAVELCVTRVQSDELGFHQVRLAQSVRDLPVRGAEILVHVDADDHIYLVQGKYLPTPQGLPSAPALSRETARERVLSRVQGAEVGVGHLIVFTPDLRQSQLAYEFEVQRSAIDRRLLTVAADTAETLREIPITLD